MKIFQIILLTIIAVVSISCGKKTTTDKTENVYYVATTHALGAILNEMCQGIGECRVILQPGASPHTYSPVPSDIAASSKAKAVFYADENADGWAKNLNNKVVIRLLGMVPDSLILHFEHVCEHSEGHDEHDHEMEGIDPHFWTDPFTVKQIIPKLADTLCSLDPLNAEKYKANASAFSKKLDALCQRLNQELAPYKGRSVFLFHPSFLYLLRSSGLTFGGAIELAPGKEPSPKYISELSKLIRQAGCRAIYSEPQLPEAPAKTVAEGCNSELLMLDPIGGADGRKTYEEIVLFNLSQLLKGF